MHRFPITFDPAYGALSRALLLRPADSYVDVAGHHVTVRMGWAFRASFDGSCVASTWPLATSPASRGVHGWGGRWLVNGSGRGILVIALYPPQRARVMGFPVKLRELMVSVESPSALAEVLGPISRDRREGATT